MQILLLLFYLFLLIFYTFCLILSTLCFNSIILTFVLGIIDNFLVTKSNPLIIFTLCSSRMILFFLLIYFWVFNMHSTEFLWVMHNAQENGTGEFWRTGLFNYSWELYACLTIIFLCTYLINNYVEPIIHHRTQCQRHYIFFQNVGLLRTQAFIHLFIQKYTYRSHYISHTRLNTGNLVAMEKEFLFLEVYILMRKIDSTTNVQYNMIEWYKCHSEC